MTNIDQDHTGDVEPAVNDTRPCRYCGTVIAKNACICPTCKYWQRGYGWLNWVAFAGGLAGLVAIVGSAIVYMYNQTWGWYSNDILSCSDLKYPGSTKDPNGEMIVVNAGHDDVIIISLIIDIIAGSLRGNVGIPLNSVVKEGQISTITMPYSPPTPLVADVTKAKAIYNKSGKPSEKMLRNALYRENNNQCVFLTFSSIIQISIESSFLATYGWKIVTLPVEATLSFTSAHAGKIISVPITQILATFRFEDGPGCTFTDWIDQ